MFRSKTVFVLGAGSSCELGLPTGEGLKYKIAQLLDIKFNDWGDRQISGDFQIMQAFYDHAMQPNGRRGDPNPYLYSAWHLRDALPQAISIDNLLDAHRDDERSEICGKLGIVGAILDAEQSSKLYLNPSEQKRHDFTKFSNTWFAGFVKILTEGVTKKELPNIFNNVSFINFNYDRCIEQYLYHALQVYYGVSQDVVTPLLSQLKIYHPYGQVGALPWQSSKLVIAPFGSEKTRLLPLSKQIKTFNERVHEKDEISHIRDAIRSAEVIVFLGFAFHRQNLELLGGNEEFNAKRVYATAYGISQSDCNVVQSDLKALLRQKGRRKAIIEIRNNLKCFDLFNEYWRSLTSN